MDLEAWDDMRASHFWVN